MIQNLSKIDKNSNWEKMSIQVCDTCFMKFTDDSEAKTDNIKAKIMNKIKKIKKTPSLNLSKL